MYIADRLSLMAHWLTIQVFVNIAIKCSFTAVRSILREEGGPCAHLWHKEQKNVFNQLCIRLRYAAVRKYTGRPSS